MNTPPSLSTCHLSPPWGDFCHIFFTSPSSPAIISISTVLRPFFPQTPFSLRCSALLPYRPKYPHLAQKNHADHDVLRSSFGLSERSFPGMRTSTYATIIPRYITLVSWFTAERHWHPISRRRLSLVFLGFFFVSFALFPLFVHCCSYKD